MSPHRAFACFAPLALVLASCATPTEAPSSAPSPRIGVYDSRSVAIAFVGSAVYAATDGAELEAKRAEHEAALAGGDELRARELEAWGRSRQARLHRQGFGTEPVDDLLAHIDEHLARISAEEGLEAIVSQWDSETLASYPDAERVDVTQALVDALEPTERQKSAAAAIREHEPVPDEELDRLEH